MQVNHFSGADIATTPSNQDGPTIITWLREPDIQCDGWINGGKLFAPRDGQSAPGTWTTQGTLIADGGWYDIASGQLAVIVNGLPTVLEGVL